MTRILAALALGRLLVGCATGDGGFGHGTGPAGYGSGGVGPYDNGPKTPTPGATYMG